MKKILFTLVCLIMVGISSVNAQTAKIILQHGDEATFFPSNGLQDAIDAAESGDVIYLNEGTFVSSRSNSKSYYQSSGTPYYVSVDKSLTFIGAGADKTYLFNFVELEDSISVTFDGMKVAGIGMTDNYNVRNIKNMNLRKCYINLLFFNGYSSDSNLNVANISIDRCFLLDLTLYYGTFYGLFNNCKIQDLVFDDTEGGDLQFKNCNIRSYLGTRLASLENCILEDDKESDYGIVALAITNCLYYQQNTTHKVSASNENNVWKSDTDLFTEDGECTLSDDELKTRNYIGTDGTVIGVNGGSTPFDLNPTRPRVSEYSIEVDPQTRKMTVNLNVANK